MINKVILIGNLGADPELRYTQDGKAILGMRLATSETWKVGEEKKERTEWHSVTLFGPSAEGLSKFISKGMKVYVEGRLQTREYESKKNEGVLMKATEVIAQNVKVLTPKGGPREAPNAQVHQLPVPDQGDDDIPF